MNSDKFLYGIVLAAVVLILALAYIAADGNIAMAAILLVTVGVAFVMLLGVLRLIVSAMLYVADRIRGE